jgi:hypothetical protein
MALVSKISNQNPGPPPGVPRRLFLRLQELPLAAEPEQTPDSPTIYKRCVTFIVVGRAYLDGMNEMLIRVGKSLLIAAGLFVGAIVYICVGLMVFTLKDVGARK